MVRALFALVLIAGLVSCRRENEGSGDFQHDNVNSAFAAQVDSVVFSFNTTQAPYISNSTFDAVFNEPDSANTAKYSVQIYNPNTLRPSIVIRKGVMQFSDSLPSDSLFESFFQPGTYSYSVNAMNGFEVLWVDMNGTLWNTSEMNGDQTGHSFRITNCRTFTDANGVFCVKISAEFSCTLYHPANPAIQMTNALFEGIIRKE